MSLRSREGDGLVQTLNIAVSRASMAFNHTGSWRYLHPSYVERLAPCREMCPAGTDIPKVVSLIAKGKNQEAYALIRKANPFPAVCGRVCYHPCESRCSRAQIDSGISVQGLERYVSEVCLEQALNETPSATRPEKVAIVGSGPAGLTCAHFLAKQGVGVAVFEREDKAGGMLRVGIPEYRLPRNILDREIRNIQDLGVEFRLGCQIGRDISLDSIRRDFNAAVLTVGAHKSRSTGLNINSDGRILSGLGFLRSVNMGMKPLRGDKILIVGGGNTAIDAARVGVRLGFESLVVYRRSRAEMPAHGDEVDAALEEGVKFLFLSAPESVRVSDEGLEVECLEMKLGAPDSSGRRRPEPVSGSTFILQADYLIEAIGEDPELDFAPITFSESGLFIAGDASSGPSTVIKAIASGRQAAFDVFQFLGIEASRDPDTMLPEQHFSPEMVNRDYFTNCPRSSAAIIPLAQRQSTFSEIIQTFSSANATAEAKRCISCGVCNQCDTCWETCPEAAITRSDAHHYQINLDYCKGCGICAQECPRGAICLSQEDL